MSNEPQSGNRPDHETGGIQHGFQLPGWMWITMVSCYAVFFLLITLATGHGARALFAIVVSIGFAVMFFSVASVISAIKGRERPSPLSRGEDLQTYTGHMSLPAVAGQVLIIPVALVLFSIGIAIITLIVR